MDMLLEAFIDVWNKDSIANKLRAIFTSLLRLQYAPSDSEM